MMKLGPGKKQVIINDGNGNNVDIRLEVRKKERAREEGGTGLRGGSQPVANTVDVHRDGIGELLDCIRKLDDPVAVTPGAPNVQGAENVRLHIHTNAHTHTHTHTHTQTHTRTL